MSALLYKMEVCDLGIEWFTAVQHGSNLRKGENTVEFKTLFPILKKYLADDADVPCFFRELMAMVTTVTEEEWGSSKDPSTKTNSADLCQKGYFTETGENHRLQAYAGNPR